MLILKAEFSLSITQKLWLTAVRLAVMGPNKVYPFVFFLCVPMSTKNSDSVSWTGLTATNFPITPSSKSCHTQGLCHPEMSYLQPPISAGWQEHHKALFLQMCSWAEGLWLCCFSSSLQMFSSTTLCFLAVGEDYWFSCTLVVSQLWEVLPLVPLLFVTSLLKPYVFHFWLLLILASWVKLLESS